MAVKRLGALRDPSAIAALERIVSPLDDDAARGVVELVSTMPGDEAALSLARHAVFYPSLPVRAAAAKKLAARDKFSFVPQLLALMYTPVTSQLFLAPTSGGIGLRHSFIREGLDQKEQLILDNEYVRVALPGGDGLESGFRALVDAAATAARREMLVAAQNEFAEKLNGRVGWVLKQTTGQDLPAQPEPWWNWWSDYNDLQAGGSKQVATIRQYAAVPVADRPQLSQGSRIVSECLVAGTLVWTAAGPVAIEKIRLGDLVLSQHADTGELAYKPVLRTTVREKRPLVKFTVAGETFQTTRVHVFWVSGEGWKKAGDLQSGMVLHTANGPARLSDLAPAADAQTYNLVVADFSSYFVGRAKLYSHDVTLRQPSRTLVPGLTPE